MSSPLCTIPKLISAPHRKDLVSPVPEMVFFTLQVRRTIYHVCLFAAGMKGGHCTIRMWSPVERIRWEGISLSVGFRFWKRVFERGLVSYNDEDDYTLYLIHGKTEVMLEQRDYDPELDRLFEMFYQFQKERMQMNLRFPEVRLLAIEERLSEIQLTKTKVGELPSVEPSPDTTTPGDLAVTDREIVTLEAGLVEDITTLRKELRAIEERVSEVWLRAIEEKVSELHINEERLINSEEHGVSVIDRKLTQLTSEITALNTARITLENRLNSLEENLDTIQSKWEESYQNEGAFYKKTMISLLRYLTRDDKVGLSELLYELTRESQ